MCCITWLSAAGNNGPSSCNSIALVDIAVAGSVVAREGVGGSRLNNISKFSSVVAGATMDMAEVRFLFWSSVPVLALATVLVAAVD